MKFSALTFLLAFGLVPLANAGVIERAQQQQAADQWSAWGGEIGVRWNTDLMDVLGMTIESTEGKLQQTDFRQHAWFDLRESNGLQFAVRNGELKGFDAGSLQMRGGYVLGLPDGSHIDLRNLSIRVRTGDPKVLDLVSADGKAWFFSDRVMFELDQHDTVLAVRAADIRISPMLASAMGEPQASGWELADMAMNTEVFIQGGGARPDEMCDPYPWPNVQVPGGNGATYQADLFMQTFSVQTVGCLNCDPVNETGFAGFAPSSSLINNRNDGSPVVTVPGDPLGTSKALHTGFVAWFTKFTGSPPNYNPPYKNDQHPFLIWNLYRTNADGSIVQIGRSGVKHAFLTINGGCEDSCDHFSNHALGRGCSDTYGVGNNDSPSDMGPRSEIVPAHGLWGRCGSIWDPSCDGSQHNNGNDSWAQRMKVLESDLDATLHPGATYRMESWYVARDDIDIYNSMATLAVTPQHSGNSWSLSNQSNYRLGPAIDRWVDPRNPAPNAINVELANADGHTKVAVKATDLGGGNWRYDYAVMNLDYARAITQAPENGPDPRVLSNAGFDSFTVPMPSGATVTATSFRNGVSGGSGTWQVAIGPNSVTWSAGDQPTLDWGTMYTFSMTVNASPRVTRPTLSSLGNGAVALHVANTGDPQSYHVRSLVPLTTSN